MIQEEIRETEPKISKKIWLSSPHMGGNELNYIHEAFDTNWVAPLGPNVDGFECDLASYLKDGVSVAALSSGTAAIHLALILIGVKEGDEVICQSFTFSASANPIIYQKATPIFVDSEADTWNMCPVLLKEAIKDRISLGKKPKAIIPVHLYGMPAKMEEILAVAKEYQIPVIEDAAEALGSHFNGKKMGTLGALAALSFNGNKIITTSGGGAIVSENAAIIEKARFLATQARDNAPHYEHSHIGYNYRMSNICAGIGRGQMEVLDERVNKRREIFAFYEEHLGKLPGISFQPEADGAFSNRWLTAMIVNSSLTGGITREDIRLSLATCNIESRPLWKPMHLQPVFEDYPYYDNNVSRVLFNNGLCLPSGSNLEKEDLERVVTTIKELINKA
ncbi:putative pyridoxal phosphate-dependent aminotransferase EpsN [compost metagenome]